ncbi:MAG: GTPase Era [Gemmatimonadota bacterium]|jgi:GTP-binding protein Era|nr:GTPase Era [Gemmatimonadota bacterium]MDQ8146434.1 GTPase Era [Gemmatimonadota bacterium]MDQ8148361.1 GTPase Era [Gemmatimonadota bacterium]MDQ8156167.1 GTPase Era [Gemmatimonadota bacterium]MDQ8176152.1 GTPase Era [Gemmatimonadota bacterium]
MSRAGFVTLVGRPNGGKSTLLNHLVGTKLAIVSPKPQSTRDRVVGILIHADTQMVLFDTPGLLEPRYDLHRSMRRAAHEAIAEADLILHLVDGLSDPTQREALAALAGLTASPKAEVLTVVTKADQLSATQRERWQSEGPNTQLISAATGEGISLLLNAIAARLPVSPFLYPEDDVSTQQTRFFASEFVREAVFEQLEDEVPYGVAVEIEEFREERTPVYIRAVMHVERDSQKRILIGSGGSRIRAIGQAARPRIEALIDRPVYLDLWVKVLTNWRRNPVALRRLGYQLPEEADR